jgi:hypothetical protein
MAHHLDHLVVKIRAGLEGCVTCLDDVREHAGHERPHHHVQCRGVTALEGEAPQLENILSHTTLKVEHDCHLLLDVTEMLDLTPRAANPSAAKWPAGGHLEVIGIRVSAYPWTLRHG